MNRKSTYDELVQRFKRLEALIECSQLATVQLTNDNIITNINPEFTRVFGFELKEASGKRIDPLITLGDYREEAEELSKRTTNGSTIHKITKRRRKDGTLIDVEIFAGPLKVEGEVVGSFGQYKDITERKLTETALRESEERWQGLVNNAAIGIYQVTDQGIFKMVNPMLARIFGYRSPDNFLTNVKNISDLYLHPEERTPILNAIKKSGYVDGLEIQFRHKDGKIIWIRASSRIIPDRSGKFIYEGFMADITESKRAEEALKLSEATYREIFNTVNDTIWIHDIDTFKFIDVNNKVTEMFGYSAREALELSVEDISSGVPPFTRETAVKLLRKARAGEPQIFDWHARHKDGHLFWTEVSLKRGTIAGRGCLLAIERDITERKQAEEALRESEERYRSFVQNFQGIAFRGKMDFTPIFFHGAVEEITGYSEDELLAGNPRWDQVIHADDLDILLSEQEKKLHSVPEYIYEREYRILREDRQIRWVHEIIQNICDDAGQPVMLQGAIYDITDRKLTEEALRKNEEKYRLLVENANDAILIIQDERIKFFNPLALKLTGYSADEFLDISFKVFIHPQDRAKVVDRYRKRIKGKEAISTYNCRLISKQQKTIWAQVNAIRTVWEEKEATLTFLRDITQLKQAESRLQHTERMESLGTLAGGIAHDFNNILSAIIGYTELSLIDADKGTSLENNLQEVNKAGTRARDLVKQILAFARQSDEEQKPLQVTIIANEVLKLIRSTIPTTIEVRENIKSHSVIMGNPSQVHQIFMNLCTNAAQAMEESGGILEVDLSDVNSNDHRTLSIS
ncbi:MAG: PAS domain S-box protein, partial [Desulfobacterales bacterium]|nr:PAS domain S-box protein [Desulfobacterales bacterium]